MTIKITEVSPDQPLGKEFPFAMKLSMAGDTFITIGRFKEMDQALTYSMDLIEFIKKNNTVSDKERWKREFVL